MDLQSQVSFILSEGYCEVAVETAMALCRIALWDGFEGRILTYFPVQPKKKR